MKIDLEIKALAKQLYLTPKDENPKNRKYSTRQIADELRQGCDKKHHHATIARWIKDGQWEDDWDEYLKSGAWKTVDTKTDIEKQTDDARSAKLALYYENNDLHLELSDEIITNMLEKYQEKSDVMAPADFANVVKINIAAKVLAKEKEQDIEALEMRDSVLEINYNVIHLDTEPLQQIEKKDDEQD